MFKPNRVSAFRPLTPSLSSSFHPSTHLIASRFSTTLRHFPASPKGGKNGWSVPNTILNAPSFLPRPSFAAPPPCAYSLARPIASLTKPSSAAPYATASNHNLPRYHRASCARRPAKTGSCSMHEARRDDSCGSAPPECARRRRKFGWRSRTPARMRRVIACITTCEVQSHVRNAEYIQSSSRTGIPTREEGHVRCHASPMPAHRPHNVGARIQLGLSRREKPKPVLARGHPNPHRHPEC